MEGVDVMDFLSYLMGKKAGEGNLVLEDGEDYAFSDPNNDGNVVMVKNESESEVSENG